MTTTMMIDSFEDAECGVEARIFSHVNGFAVSLFDVDSGETASQVRIFADLDAARRYARTLITEAT
jgi:hypothetical protein